MKQLGAKARVSPKLPRVSSRCCECEKRSDPWLERSKQEGGLQEVALELSLEEQVELGDHGEDRMPGWRTAGAKVQSQTHCKDETKP